MRTGASARAGRAGGAVVEPVAVAARVEARARADVEQRERRAELLRDPRERGADHRAAADLVGLRAARLHQREDLGAMREAHVDEERAGIGVALARVDRGERMIEPAEQEVVDDAEQHVRAVRGRRRLLHEREHRVVVRDDRQMRSYSGE